MIRGGSVGRTHAMPRFWPQGGLVRWQQQVKLEQPASGALGVPEARWSLLIWAKASRLSLGVVALRVFLRSSERPCLDVVTLQNGVVQSCHTSSSLVRPDTEAPSIPCGGPCRPVKDSGRSRRRFLFRKNIAEEDHNARITEYRTFSRKTRRSRSSVRSEATLAG